MPDHFNIPRGAEAAHPPGYVQQSDPGAVGAFKPWWVTDDDTTPTEVVDFRIRNAANSDWISYGDFLTGSIIGSVTSVFGRAGVVVATEGDYSLGLLSDATITTPGDGDYIRHNGSVFVNTAIPLTDLGSGTPDINNFLRGDGVWSGIPSHTHAATDVTSGTFDIARLPNSIRDIYVPFIIDGGGSVITTGLKGGFIVPAGTIVEATLLALDNLTGSIVVDLWKDTYANHPPTVADTITASAKPTISSATKSKDTTLTGWMTATAAGDVLFVNVDSVATFTRVLLSLIIRRS